MSFFSNLFGSKKNTTPPLPDYSMIGWDMHSHFIPGIDDGAKDLDDSLSLIRAMADLGYRKLITTPHIMSDSYQNTPEIILGGLEKVRTAIKQQGIPIELHAAAEYYCDYEFMGKIGKEPLLNFGKQKFLLFEVSYLNAPDMLDDVIFKLQSEGYKPILAHPERYPFWFNTFEKYHEIKQKGVYLQMNINSLTGHYGIGTQKIAERMIEEEMISFLGSDCHHPGHINLTRQTLNNPHLRKLVESGRLMNNTIDL